MRPRLSRQDLTLYLEGRRLIAEKAVDQAFIPWRKLHSQLMPSSNRLDNAWLAAERGRVLGSEGRWWECRQAFEEAIALARYSSNDSIEAQLWRLRALVLSEQGDEDAIVALEAAVSANQAVAPESLAMAAIKLHLCDRLVDYSNYSDASVTPCYRHVIAVLERQAPDSFALARALNALANAASERGDGDGDMFYRCALAILRRINPESLASSMILNNLSVNAFVRGNFALAATLGREAVELARRVAPGSTKLASWLTRSRQRLREELGP